MLSRLPQRMKTSIKPLVFVDFDETITVKDTIGLLGNVGVKAHGSRIPWTYFVDGYMDDYNNEKQRQQEHPVSADSTSPLQQQIAFIDSFRAVEKASLDRISSSGILGGLTRQDWQREGQQVPLRPLAQSTLLEHVTPDRLYIVSLNWCKDWIRGALLLGGDYSDFELDDDHLISNDLTYDSTTHLSTGVIQPVILNTSDKARHIQSVLQHRRQYYQQQQGSSNTTPSSIYIGDSTGDLSPLVECDIGIIIGKNERLLEILQQAGITVNEGLEPLKAIAANGRSTTNTIYRVDDWDTIAQSGILE